MSLTDKEILELTELCNAVIEGTPTEQQQARLGEMLSRSGEARKFYVRFTGISASLYYYAGEMQTEERDGGPTPVRGGGRWKWVIGACALAASVVVAAWLYPRPVKTVARISDEEFVGRLTGSKDCLWNGKSPSIALGSRLGKGEHLELARGYAEITFDCGAKVVLEGPASLDLNSPWTATLNSGKLKAKLPLEAMGFTVVNSMVKVMDLGTEFAMIADPAGGGTEVLVLKGQVEAAPSVGGDGQSILLSTNESRRFARTETSAVENSAAKFSDLTHPVQMDRFEAPVSYAHWSFDETAGFLFKVDDEGAPAAGSDLRLENILQGSEGGLHARGRWERSLKFDGHLYGRATVKGISDNSPHTVAFWVNVPKDASLANAYAMVAWGAQRPQLGTHPIHIAWNRNADEGVIGVLRTDYGGGYALGATPIRDGQWHHVAVVFMPRDDAESPMEVKQYLDGRLEGEGVKSPPGSDVFRTTDKSGSGMNDTLWLGTRVGLKNVRQDRFTGRMDELYVADRALEPQEIVTLMANNHL